MYIINRETSFDTYAVEAASFYIEPFGVLKIL